MTRVFTYILHKGGVVDDSATELVAAARRVAPDMAATAIVTGWGPDLDAVCKSLSSCFTETWMIAHQDLAYPNAELVRQALVKVIPPNSIVLAAHECESRRDKN